MLIAGNLEHSKSIKSL